MPELPDESSDEWQCICRSGGLMSKSYDYIMRELLCHPECSLYALVDGLQFERHFGYEIESEIAITYPLFDLYPDSKLAFAGPWLIRLNRSEFYRGRLKELDMKYPALSWLLSPLSPEGLLQKFKEFLTIELPNGKSALFRFYDPRVLEHLSVWLELPERSRLIQGVKQWVLTSRGEVLDLRTELDERNFGKR